MDEIDKLMEETKEAAEYQEVRGEEEKEMKRKHVQEISRALNGQLSSQELESCEEELAELLSRDAPTLPEAPTHKLPEAVTEKRERVALTS